MVLQGNQKHVMATPASAIMQSHAVPAHSEVQWSRWYGSMEAAES